MVSWIFVNINSGDGLLPDGTKPPHAMLLIGPLGTNFSEILIEIYTFSFKKVHLTPKKELQ